MDTSDRGKTDVQLLNNQSNAKWNNEIICFTSHKKK